MEEAEYKEKYAHLVAAFCDEAFEKELKEVRDELVKLIEKLLEGAEKQEPRLKNYFSIESRIKGIDSFKEKLNRKSYIRDWEITEDTTENQKFIKSHLTDLIGIRIDCYFMRTEKFLYDFSKEISMNQIRLIMSSSISQRIKSKQMATSYTSSLDYTKTNIILRFR